MLILAGGCRLQEGELELSQRVPGLLSLWRQRRNSAVPRIDDERSPPADWQVQGKGALTELGVDVPLGARRPPAVGAVAADDVRDPPIELGAFLVGEKLFVGVLVGAFQRNV